MAVYNRIYDEDKWKLVNPENKKIVEDYLMEIKSQKKRESTQIQYKNDLRILCIYVLDYCKNKSFLELTKRDFRNFVINATENWGVSNARANRLMSAIRTLLSFLEDDDEEYEDYTRNAAAKVKGLPKEGVRDVVFLSDDTIMKLYDKFIAEERYKEATLLGILYDSGCRKNEILQVKRNSVTENGNSTNTVEGKRGKKFKVLYFRLTKEANKLYEASRKDDNEYLFVTSLGSTANASYLYELVKGWIDDIEALTGDRYDQLNVHSFRHCFIENMVNGTHYLCREKKLGAVPIEKVKVLAHHSDVSTTDSYRSNDEERDIEDLFGIKLGE